MRNVQAINAQREKANRSLSAARDLGTQLTAAQGDPAKAGTVAALEEQFGNAHKDAMKEVASLRRLEAIDQVEVESESLTAAAGGTQTRETQDRRASGTTLAELRASIRNRNVQPRIEFRAAALETFTEYLRADVRAAEAFAGSLGERLSLTPGERQALVTIQNDLGGFLAPDEFSSEVLKDLAGFAVIRGLARVMRTSRPALTFPTIQSATTNANIYASGYAGAWKAEGYVTGGTAPTVQNQPTFGQTRIPVHVWQPNAIEVTQELLEDSEANLEQILSQVIAETLGLDEDSAFINGSGVGQPQGLLSSAAGIATVATGTSNVITYNGLVDLFTTLPAQYRQNAVWLMNSLCYGAILKLVDTYGRPLFPVNAPVDMLWGKKIVISEFMPNVATAATPIAFGDFKYFGIVDRRDLRMQRLAERFAPNVGILPTRRTGGQVLRKAAFRLQVVT